MEFSRSVGFKHLLYDTQYDPKIISCLLRRASDFCVIVGGVFYRFLVPNAFFCQDNFSSYVRRAVHSSFGSWYSVTNLLRGKIAICYAISPAHYNSMFALSTTLPVQQQEVKW